MQQLSAVKPLMARNSKGAHLTIASAKPIDLGHRTCIVMHVLCTSYTECIVSLIIVDRDNLFNNQCILINLKGISILESPLVFVFHLKKVFFVHFLTDNISKMLQVYETLVRESPLKNDGYETICFVKLIIDNF